MKDHDRPLLGLQAPEPSLELIAIRHGGRAVLRHWLCMDHPDFRRPSTLMTSDVGAGIDEEPTHPCVEPIGVAEPWQLPPRVDESFLNGVLGARPVSEDEEGDAIEAVGV